MRDISYSAESAIDDMVRDMSSVDTHDVGKTADIHIKLIEFENWEALAYDLALGVADEKELAAGYGVELHALHSTMTNKNFQKMLETKKREVEGLGDGADFTVKMRLITNKAAPRLLRRLMSNSTEDKDFAKMFEIATRLAQLEPSKDEDAGDERGILGTGISINLYGMPGLEHIGTVKNTDVPVNTAEKYRDPIEDAEVLDDDSGDLPWL